MQSLSGWGGSQVPKGQSALQEKLSNGSSLGLLGLWERETRRMDGSLDLWKQSSPQREPVGRPGARQRQRPIQLDWVPCALAW